MGLTPRKAIQSTLRLGYRRPAGIRGERSDCPPGNYCWSMRSRLTLRKVDWLGATLAVAVFLVVVVPLSHFIHPSRSAPGPTVIVIQRDRHFHPDRLTIAQHTVVQIMNDDRFVHHAYVKSPLMNYDSGDDPIGTSIYVEFDHPGTYDVQCAIHPLMHLWVTVKGYNADPAVAPSSNVD